MRRLPLLFLASAVLLGTGRSRAESAAGATPPAGDASADQLRGELAEAQKNLLRARQDAEALRNQLQAAQDDLLVRTRALTEKVAQAQRAQAAAEAKLTARAASGAPDPRLAALQADLADTQKMTIADQATISSLKNDLAAAQAALAAARAHPAASPIDLRPELAKLAADKRQLLASNEKLAAEIKQLRGKSAPLAPPPSLAPPAAQDPRVDVRMRELQNIALVAQQQELGDRKTITDLQAQLTAAKSGAETTEARRQREALLTEVQTALAAAQLADRTDREALAHAQTDLEAARTALAQSQTSASAFAQTKTDLAAATAASTQAQAAASAAAAQRDQSARDLATARADTAAARAQLEDAQAKLAAFVPGADVAHQLADAQAQADLFKRRSADLAVQVDQLTVQNKRLVAAAAAAKLPPAVIAAAPAGGAEVRWYTVQEGDSLTRISERYYGTPKRWPEIYDANLDQLQGETAPVVGQRLRIP